MGYNLHKWHKTGIIALKVVSILFCMVLFVCIVLLFQITTGDKIRFWQLRIIYTFSLLVILSPINPDILKLQMSFEFTCIKHIGCSSQCLHSLVLVIMVYVHDSTCSFYYVIWFVSTTQYYIFSSFKIFDIDFSISKQINLNSSSYIEFWKIWALLFFSWTSRMLL